MSKTSSSVEEWFFQFYIDGFLYSSFKPSVLSVQNMHIAVLKGVLALLCWAIRLFNGCLVSPIYGSLHFSLHLTTYTRLLFVCGVWSLGCTSFCLSVFLGLKNTGMWCLLKILLSFSDTPDTYGMTILLHLFFLSSTTTELVFLLERVAVFTKVQLGSGIATGFNPLGAKVALLRQAALLNKTA